MHFSELDNPLAIAGSSSSRCQVSQLRVLTLDGFVCQDLPIRESRSDSSSHRRPSPLSRTRNSRNLHQTLGPDALCLFQFDGVTCACLYSTNYANYSCNVRVLLGIRPRFLIDFLSVCFRTLADCNVIDRRLADAALQSFSCISGSDKAECYKRLTRLIEPHSPQPNHTSLSPPSARHIRIPALGSCFRRLYIL
jgi:hypothetical protein